VRAIRLLINVRFFVGFSSFILRVLPDAFVIHLPHAASPGTVQWRRTPGYGRYTFHVLGVLFILKL